MVTCMSVALAVVLAVFYNIAQGLKLFFLSLSHIHVILKNNDGF